MQSQIKIRFGFDTKQLPSFRQPHSVQSPGSPHLERITSSQSPLSLSTSIATSVFYSRLKGGTPAAVPLPFMLGDPALCGSHPILV